MKASSVLLAVFSGLAIAAPALDPRQDLDKANDALGKLIDENTKVKERKEESLQRQLNERNAWKKNAALEVELTTKLTSLLKDGTPEEKDVTNELSGLVKASADKAEESIQELEEQVSKPTKLIGCENNKANVANYSERGERTV